VTEGPLLYGHALSEESYKVRLLLGFLGVSYRTRTIDFYPGREQEGAAFRELNPVGDLPVLVDGDLVLRDAEAILAYLAVQHDPERRWYPQDAAALGAVMAWLGFARTHLSAMSEARGVAMLGLAGDLPALVAAARRAFRILDDHMTHREFAGGLWVAGAGPTIADVAAFPAIALSRDAGIEHDEYPALRRFIRRFRALPGFVTMPGIPDYY
jgi:glutathione S-transferase